MTQDFKDLEWEHEVLEQRFEKVRNLQDSFIQDSFIQDSFIHTVALTGGCDVHSFNDIRKNKYVAFLSLVPELYLHSTSTEKLHHRKYLSHRTPSLASGFPDRLQGPPAVLQGSVLAPPISRSPLQYLVNDCIILSKTHF